MLTSANLTSQQCPLETSSCNESSSVCEPLSRSLFHHSVLRYLSVDPAADLCVTNQIYSVLLRTFELKGIPEVQNTHLKMTKCDLVVARTRHHRACLLKYYPRQPCTPSFVKSRMLRQLQTHFLLFYPCMYTCWDS